MDETAVSSACARHYKIAKCRTPQETKNSPGSGSGSLGPRFIQREIVLSQRSKPSIRSSPWMRGAPQVGFSTTIRKTNSRTSFGVGFLPTRVLTLEISFQYKRKPARCQRITVSGVTTIRACSHPDQNRRTATQNNLSNGLRQ